MKTTIDLIVTKCEKHDKLVTGVCPDCHSELEAQVEALKKGLNSAKANSRKFKALADEANRDWSAAAKQWANKRRELEAQVEALKGIPAEWTKRAMATNQRKLQPPDYVSPARWRGECTAQSNTLMRCATELRKALEGSDK